MIREHGTRRHIQGSFVHRARRATDGIAGMRAREMHHRRAHRQTTARLGAALSSGCERWRGASRERGTREERLIPGPRRGHAAPCDRPGSQRRRSEHDEQKLPACIWDALLDDPALETRVRDHHGGQPVARRSQRRPGRGLRAGGDPILATSDRDGSAEGEARNRDDQQRVPREPASHTPMIRGPRLRGTLPAVRSNRWRAREGRTSRTTHSRRPRRAR